jgi:hypothetical protein
MVAGLTPSGLPASMRFKPAFRGGIAHGLLSFVITHHNYDIPWKFAYRPVDSVKPVIFDPHEH